MRSRGVEVIVMGILEYCVVGSIEVYTPKVKKVH